MQSSKKIAACSFTVAQSLWQVCKITPTDDIRKNRYPVLVSGNNKSGALKSLKEAVSISVKAEKSQSHRASWRGFFSEV